MTIFDRIRTTTTQTGTLSTISVGATPPSGFQKPSARFSVNDADIPVVVAHQTADEWQVCWCTYSSADTFTVNSVIYSSNSDNAVSFSSGTKDVFVVNSSASVGGLREVNTWTKNQIFQNTGLKVLDTNASHTLTLKPGSDLSSSDKTLTIITGNADRTLDIPNTALSFDTVAAVNSATIDSNINHIRTAGYYATGDGGGALYKRVASGTTGAGTPRIASNSAAVIWELSEPSLINVRQWGAYGDGTTNDATVIQACATEWVTGNLPKTLLFPPGRYSITSQILFRPPQNTNRQKTLLGYGADILNNISGSDVALLFTTLNAQVGSTKYYWANAVIEGLTVRGGANPWAFKAGGPADSNWMWQFTLKNLNAYDFSGDGFYCYDGFFESAFYSCAAWANTNNATGICYKFENGPLSVISSIEIHNANTRYGKNGIRTISPVVDVDIFGGTFLQAQEEGIRFELCQGQIISGAHVEMNWQAGGGTIRPGIQVSGHGLFSGITGQSGDANKQNYVLRTYASGGGIVVSGGVAGGAGHTAFGYYDALNGANDVTVSQGVTFTEAKSIKTLNTTGNGTRVSQLVYRSNFVNYAASVTPDLDLGTWFQVGALTGNITVNAPTNPRSGQVINIIFKQDATGGRTVTFNAIFLFPSGTAPTATAAANATDMVSCQYDATNNKWLCSYMTAFA